MKRGQKRRAGCVRGEMEKRLKASLSLPSAGKVRCCASKMPLSTIGPGPRTQRSESSITETVSMIRSMRTFPFRGVSAST